MIKNYFKRAWRNFRKNKLLSLINLGGLSIGITSVLLIGMYIHNETGYDDFQKNKSSVFRVGFHFWQSGKLLGEGEAFTPPFGPDARAKFPEIGSFTRLSSDRTAFISYNDKAIKVDHVHHADTSFFRIFSYALLKGSPETALRQPYSIVLTAGMAQRLFGKEEAVGKVVRVDNQTDYLVTGVAEDAPANSHLDYNALISFATLYSEPGNYMDWNGGEQYITYLQLRPGTDAASLEKKLPGFMWEHINRDYATRGIRIDATLQPLSDIHLYYGDNARTLRTNLYVFSTVALLILIISCVNYVNLTTAQSMTRFKEIGVRKVLGARRSQLIRQFLTEAIWITIAAFLVALGLVKLATPLYTGMIGRPLPSLTGGLLVTLLSLFALVIAIGFIAGSYVAFYLSSFNAIKIFKSLLPRSGNGGLRRGLVTGQFAITVALMICTLIVSLQLRFSKSLPMGFDKDQVLVLPLIGKEAQRVSPVLQTELLRITGVQEVAAVSEIPYDGINSNGFVAEGTSQAMIIHQLVADEHFLPAFHIQMASGHFFSKDIPSEADGYVINEALASALGWENPIGKIINRNGDHRVIGVIRDFHYASLHDKIEPLIISRQPTEIPFSYLAIRYQTGDISGLVASVRDKWKAGVAGASSDYWFLDTAFNSIYKSEERFEKIFFYFSVLSILLSLAGVYGLVTLSIRQRMKEFGIRRVLGARLSDIITLTAMEFVWLVMLGTIVAAPVALYYMDKWLQDFAYRIDGIWWVSGVCGLAVLAITVVTVGIQALRAAVANPVKSLRAE